MPFKMHRSCAIQAVVIGNNVYVGGVFSIIAENRATVMVYSLETGSWRTLPPYMSRYFGMAAVNNQLVLVGGWTTLTGEVTNVLGVWDEGSRTWTHPFPAMPTARHSPSVIYYQKWIVVAGGGERGSCSKKVELLDTLSGQWYEGSPLPKGCSEISSAISGNMWYLSGGSSSQGGKKHVFSVCLDELISQAVSQSTGATSQPTPTPWQTLPETPQTRSNVSILNGALLVVGGRESSAIHLYQPTIKSWVRVGDFPNQRSQCACTVLPSGEIFVAGGLVNGLITDSVNIVTII